MKTKKSFGKRILSLVLTLLMVLSLIPLSAVQGFASEHKTESVGASIKPYDGVAVTPQKVDSNNYSKLGFTSADYSEYNGWYAIRDAKEFYGFANLVNNNGEDKAKAVLVNDIVVNETVSSSGANYSWTPIGSLNDPFEGVLDGRGCTISGIYINGYSEVGLFGCVGRGSAENKPTVKNLVLSNSYICGSSYYVGGIAGRLFGTDTVISKCKIDSDVTIESRNNGDDAYIGGITGHCFGDMLSNKHSQINDCVVLGKVSAPNSLYYIGAIAGMYHENTIPSIVATNCYYIEGNVTSEKGVINIGLGCENNQTNSGCTTLKSANDSHTCIEMQRKETVANCQYDGMTAHTFCLICGKVLSGTRTVTQDPHNHIRVDENGFCPDCGGYERPKQNANGVYEIDNAGKLYWFAEQVNNGNTAINAILTADITVNEGVINESSTNAREWLPIGNLSYRYTGKFNGNNKTISGLYTNAEYRGFVGLFGSMGENAEVKNLTVKNSYFRGMFYAGGISAQQYMGRIENCSVVDVTLKAQTTGGVVGYSINSTVNNCFSTASVEGEMSVGGVVGESDGDIISNCYYLNTTCQGGINGSDISGQAEAKTAEQFASGEVGYLLGEPFGQKLGTDNIPVFSGDKVYYVTDPNDPSKMIFTNEYIEPAVDSDGDGYYEINNAAKLYWFAQQVNDGNTKINAILTADINVNSGIINENSTDARVWTPIGNSDNEYCGAFDGNGKTISGLYYNDNSDRTKMYIGLFGYIGENCKIKDVTVTNSYFNAWGRIGGIVAQAYCATIENCISTATISGHDSLGGIAGTNSTGCVMKNCVNAGKIIGEAYYIGGITGSNSYATIENCYNVGDVTGNQYTVGGIAGNNGTNGKIKNCFNVGTVNSKKHFGGIVGDNSGEIIENCYYLNTSCNGGIDGEDIAGQAEAKTAEQFASGEVAYLLGDAFGQKIGTDQYPVLGGDKVYYGYESETSTEKTYSNSPLIEELAKLGDIDLDGIVSIKDATLLSKYLVGRAELSDIQLSISDVNNDGTINISDATQIQKILVRA